MKYGSAIPLALLSCVLAKWQPVDEASFRKALKTNEQTLTACEPPISFGLLPYQF